jgi:exosome complex exonuclease DIS3/RRP44
MLLANVSVAQKILDHFNQFAILRRHPQPKPENFVPLQRASKVLGFDIKCATSRELADSLDNCVVDDKPLFNKIVRMLATRCMSQAVYFSSGEFTPKEYVHYGLASPVYTHFTSPIRRYADVLVHRLLATALGIDPLPAACEDKTKTRETCEVINHRHRMAQLAGRSSSQLFTLVFFRDRDVVEDAIITAVKSNGISVMVPRYGIENQISLWQETDATEGAPSQPNPYTYDEDKLLLTGNGQRFQIFQSIKVRIFVKTSKMRRQWLVLEVVDQGTANSISKKTPVANDSAKRKQTPGGKTQGKKKK